MNSIEESGYYCFGMCQRFFVGVKLIADRKKGGEQVSDNWVVQNLQNTLSAWNDKLAEVWQLMTMPPENFKGGGIWNVILSINRAMQAIGLALLVLFFLAGVVQTSGLGLKIN